MGNLQVPTRGTRLRFHELVRNRGAASVTHLASRLTIAQVLDQVYDVNNNATIFSCRALQDPSSEGHTAPKKET
jgi:hypothetical protein